MGNSEPAESVFAPRVAAIALAVLGCLPLANWIHTEVAFPGYAERLADWANGSVIAIGAGIVLALCSRHWQWLWPSRRAERMGRWVGRHRWRWVLAVTAAAAVVYAAVAVLLFHGRAVLIDEMVQVRQAQIFVAGRLWLPEPPHPEFFSSLNMVDAHGRVFAQFPPGGPAFLALGEAIGAGWIVNPLFGALSVVAFAAMLGVAEPNPRTAALATLLFALAPFTVFMAGSHMNHVTTLTCLLVATAALFRVTAASGPRPWLALVSGLGFGVAATVRPTDAIAFAIPAAVWYLARAIRDRRRWVDVAAAGVGVALPVAAMLYFNSQTTGAPLLFGYEVVWGKGHDLGFHRSPLGIEHTPARGLAIVNLYFLRLQDALFETPIPSLAPAVGALLLTPRLRAPDRYLLVSAALLVGVYFTYWHDGNFLGPRFVYPLTPVLALWTARFPRLFHEWALRRSAWRSHPTRGVVAYRTVLYALLTSAAIAVAVDIPGRAFAYSRWLDVDQIARPRSPDGREVRNALIFVRESWESQLVVRMWAQGISHPDAELFYRWVNACRLDSALAALEQAGGRGSPVPDATAELWPLLADSLHVSTVALTNGSRLRVDSRVGYSGRCSARLAETQAGVLPLSPYTLFPKDGNVYARDLHERDTLLLAAYPKRSVFLLRPETPDHAAMPRIYPVSVDSLRRAWEAERTM